MKGWQRNALQDMFNGSLEFIDNISNKQPWEIRAFLYEIPAILNMVLEKDHLRCQLTITVHNVKRKCLGPIVDGRCETRSYHGY